MSSSKVQECQFLQAACQIEKEDPTSYRIISDSRIILETMTLEEHLQSGGSLDNVLALKRLVGC